MLSPPTSSPVGTQAVPMGMFVGSWLAYSETFIYDQVQHQSAFRATVCARARTPGNTRFSYEDVVTLGPLERASYFLAGRAPSFAKALTQRKVQLLHAHFGVNGVFATPLAKALRRPLAVTFHGHDVAGLYPQNRWAKRYAMYQQRAPKMFDVARLLICASTELAEQLESLGAPSHKIVVHRLGIDLRHFQAESAPQEGPLRVLMVGRMVEKKGMRYGIEAFAKVAQAFPEASLSIVGDGPLQEELSALGQSLGLADKLHFLGRLDAKAVRAQMQRSQILMAPSVVAQNGDRESGILVLKEAAAMGLATIGTRHGGIPEIIDHEDTGLLVQERDVPGLAHALLQLAQDSGLRTQMGTRGRQKMEREYDTIQQNRALESLLAKLL